MRQQVYISRRFLRFPPGKVKTIRPTMAPGVKVHRTPYLVPYTVHRTHCKHAIISNEDSREPDVTLPTCTQAVASGITFCNSDVRSVTRCGVHLAVRTCMHNACSTTLTPSTRLQFLLLPAVHRPVSTQQRPERRRSRRIWSLLTASRELLCCAPCRRIGRHYSTSWLAAQLRACCLRSKHRSQA